jgi:hypothetical protein
MPDAGILLLYYPTIQGNPQKSSRLIKTELSKSIESTKEHSEILKGIEKPQSPEPKDLQKCHSFMGGIFVWLFFGQEMIIGKDPFLYCLVLSQRP